MGSEYSLGRLLEVVAINCCTFFEQKNAKVSKMSVKKYAIDMIYGSNMVLINLMRHCSLPNPVQGRVHMYVVSFCNVVRC